QMLVAGDASGTLTAWGRDAWDVKFSQAAHTKAVRSLAWAPDGRHLASGGADGTVKVHDAAGMQKQSYSPGSHARNNDGDTETVFTCVGWSADGRMVHGGTSRSSSYGWSFGEQRGGGSSSTSWGGNARTILFVGAMPGSAKRLDADSTGSIRITEGDGWESGGSSSATVRGLTAVACGRRSLLLWTATQTSLQAFSTHVPVTTQEDENGRRFTRSHSLRPGPVQPTGLSPICALSQSDDGLLLLVAAATGEIQVWSGDAPPQPLGEIDAALDGVVPAAPPRLQILVALGDGLAAGYADGTIRLMDESGRPRRTLVAGTSAITGLWYQAGGRFLLSLDADGEVWRFALEGDHVKRRLKCQARGPEQLALSHDGGLCAAPGKDAVELWDIAENKSVAALAWTGAVHELAFSADSRFLAVRDGADVTVFDCRSMLKAGSTRFEGCTRLWFAGEELVAVCGTDLHRQGWKAGAARTTVSLEADRAAHAGRVQPAGDRVLFAAGPREIRELDASTGRITARVTGTDDFAAWAVLGQRVVTASASGRMLLWKLPR
ncbi:MAG: WD40 repeat domain-containing protein, partial [Planctomycetes bacterium]|nr:WD40 repeat domain-containing protein [Planctomycetota bacterium]